MVVGWYHSHPGFGCWLSGVDINTQQSFEALNQRAVSVVIDPIQSVKGKVPPPCCAAVSEFTSPTSSVRFTAYWPAAWHFGDSQLGRPGRAGSRGSSACSRIVGHLGTSSLCSIL